jgi:mono/diheme cytochrome c family protein
VIFLTKWILPGAALALALGACDNMQHQENVRAFDPSPHFADGASARTPPAHTLARGDPAPGDPLASGRRPSGWMVDYPFPLSRAVLERGRDRFNIFCADCHGEDGYGTGIVVRRGFPRPASFHEARSRLQANGQLFDAISRGSGIMYGFGDRIAPRDRWAIVAYIRALQESQHAALADLSEEERRRLPTP